MPRKAITAGPTAAVAPAPDTASKPVLGKECEQCGEDRALSTFARAAGTEDGRSAVCRVCTG